MPLGGHRTRRPDAGFTLVELLISLSLIGLTGLVITQIMLNQSRVVQLTSEQMRVDDGLRRGMDLLSADLRALAPAQGDVMDVTATSLTVRATIGSGVVCGVTGTASVDLVPVDAAKAPMTFFSATPIPGDTLRLLRLADQSWHAVPISAVSSGTSACSVASSPFVTELDAGRNRTRLTAPLPASVGAGDVVRVTRPVRYAVSQQGLGRWYLTRSEWLSGVWTSIVVAGPFRSATGTPAGLQIQLYGATGTMLSNATRDQTVRIALLLRGLGATTSAPTGPLSGVISDSLVLSVSLRNP